MKRALFAMIAALSLLMCVWGGVAWVRSYAPAASPAPSTLPMQMRLARILPIVQFDQVGLFDVIDFLRDVSGQNMEVSWPAVSRGGIDRNTLITSRLRGVRFGEAITQIISQAGSLGYVADDNFVTIAPKDQLGRVIQIERFPTSHGSADTAMGATLVKLRFPRAELGAVLQSLSEQAGVPISCDWQELQPAGVERRMTVNVQMSRISAARALRRILADLDASKDLQFHVGPSRVVVSTREALDRQSTPTAPSGRTWIIVAMAFAAFLFVLAAWLWRRNSQTPHQMERLGRIGLAVVLLIAGVIAATTWKHGPPFWESVLKTNRLTITAHRGELRVWQTPADPAAPYQDLSHLGKATAPDQEKIFDRAGFFIRWGGSPFNSWVAGMPLLAFVPLTALLPSLWLVTSIRRWRRFGKGMCPKCGYDLRASTGRCPECGTPFRADLLAGWRGK